MKINLSQSKKDMIINIAKSVVCASIYVAIILTTVFLLFSNTIDEVFSMVEIISIQKGDEEEAQDLKINQETNRLEQRPTYGDEYGRVKIEKHNIDLGLYYGSSLDVLKNGVGQLTKTYCPGEGKTIICTGHNTEGMLKSLVNVKKNDKIVIETTYGTFTYKVYNTKIANKNDKSALPIQKEKEELILYTGYSEGEIGAGNKIFITYANLVNE